LAESLSSSLKINALKKLQYKLIKGIKMSFRLM